MRHRRRARPPLPYSDAESRPNYPRTRYTRAVAMRKVRSHHVRCLMDEVFKGEVLD
jgi:hypothetical protein